jgi:hypothetical protein
MSFLSPEQKNELFDMLSKTGETTVRENLAQGIYVPENKRELIREWLYRQRESRVNDATSRAESAASRAEAARTEEILILRSSKNNARIAAIASIIANIIAIIAIIIAMKK